jgi:hypothetical protein
MMNGRAGFRTMAILAGLLISSLAGGALAADNFWTVQTLNDNKPWEKFVDSPLSIRVEGRLGTHGGGQLRLVHCDAKFMIDNSARLRSVAPKSHLEITGRFRKEGQKVEFAVQDWKVVPSYADQFDLKSSKLQRPTPDDWRQLGDWAAERSRFYDDPELLKKASLAYTNAMETEYKSLKPNDANGHFVLAEKFKDYNLSNQRRMELVHQGLHIEWQLLQKAEPVVLKKWQEFAHRLSEQLPGASEPLKKMSSELKNGYEQDPLSTYRKADDKLRIQLHRLFLVAVTRKRLMYGAASDGHDGDAIADEIDKEIPEEHALAEKVRVSRLGYRLTNISSANRSEAESLAAAFRDRQQNDMANQALLQWVKSHETRLKGDGVVGLLQLADEYATLLKNEPAAVECLTDAYKIDPTFGEIKTRFNSLGYQWQNNRWSKSDPTSPATTAATPQSPTGITFGMSATSLRTLQGQPGALARAITSRGTTEIWSYGPSGSTRLVIRLEQRGSESEPKVTAVSNQSTGWIPVP